MVALRIHALLGEMACHPLGIQNRIHSDDSEQQIPHAWVTVEKLEKPLYILPLCNHDESVGGAIKAICDSGGLQIGRMAPKPGLGCKRCT
jgi:hypothetical protein